MSIITKVYEEAVESILEKMRPDLSHGITIKDIIKYVEEEVDIYKGCYHHYKKLYREFTNEDARNYYDNLCMTFYTLVIRFNRLIDYIKSNL